MLKWSDKVQRMVVVQFSLKEAERLMIWFVKAKIPTGDVISQSGLLQNPIVGLMLGILATGKFWI